MLFENFLIRKDQREICAQNSRNSIINENVLHSEESLMHYKGRPSNYLFQLFLKLKGRPEENSSYFSNFSHVQLHVHKMHLLNNRTCRYTDLKLTV